MKENPHHDDYFEDSECCNRIKYLKLIESTDEHAYSDLMRCLIDLFVDFKLTSIKAQLAAFETRITALENK